MRRTGECPRRACRPVGDAAHHAGSLLEGDPRLHDGPRIRSAGAGVNQSGPNGAVNVSGAQSFENLHQRLLAPQRQALLQRRPLWSRRTPRLHPGRGGPARRTVFSRIGPFGPKTPAAVPSTRSLTSGGSTSAGLNFAPFERPRPRLSNLPGASSSTSRPIRERRRTTGDCSGGKVPCERRNPAPGLLRFPASIQRVGRPESSGLLSEGAGSKGSSCVPFRGRTGPRSGLAARSACEPLRHSSLASGSSRPSPR